MKKSEVILTKYSPLMAVDTKLVGSDGDPTKTPRVYSLCRCGESKFKQEMSLGCPDLHP